MDAWRRRGQAGENRRDPDEVYELAQRLLLPATSGAYNASNAVRGLELLRQAAQRHHPAALEHLGDLYLNGGSEHLAIRRDVVQASRCFSMAAALRSTEVNTLLKEKEKAEYQFLEAAADFDLAIWHQLFVRSVLVAWHAFIEHRRSRLADCIRSANRRAHRQAWAPWLAEARRWKRLQALISRAPAADLGIMQRSFCSWQACSKLERRSRHVQEHGLWKRSRTLQLHSAFNCWQARAAQLRAIKSFAVRAHKDQSDTIKDMLTCWRSGVSMRARGVRRLAKALSNAVTLALAPSLRCWHRKVRAARDCDASAQLHNLRTQIAKLERSQTLFREQSAQEIQYWQHRFATVTMAAHSPSDNAMQVAPANRSGYRGRPRDNDEQVGMLQNNVLPTLATAPLVF